MPDAVSLPCAKGKRSAVAVVNDNPVDCQSRDRAHRSELSTEQVDGGIVNPHRHAEHHAPYSPHFGLC